MTESNHAALSIRRATVEDASEICRVHKEAVRAKARFHYSDVLIEAWIGDRETQHYKRAMQEQGEVMWLAACAGAVVGFASLRDNELNALYADSQAPSGTGTALLKAVIDEAEALGIPDLLAIASLNAVGFYVRHGFQKIGPAQLVRSGATIPAIRMRRSI
jgi:L-amino acid N-acyltransferase YncA